MKKETLVKLSDWHVPYQDEKAINVSFDFCRKVQPNVIIIDEMMDFYSISKFSRDPKRKLSLQEDLDTTFAYLSKLRKFCPKSKIISVQSNHDARMKKYLRNNAEELSELKILSVPALLRLEELDIQYKENFTFHNVLIKHGDIVRGSSSYSAKGELVKEGVSGVSGHTHRLGISFETKRSGFKFWMEGGCLCSKEVAIEYVRGIPDWQLGFSALIFKDNNVFPVLIPIINYQIGGLNDLIF